MGEEERERLMEPWEEKESKATRGECEFRVL